MKQEWYKPKNFKNSKKNWFVLLLLDNSYYLRRSLCSEMFHGTVDVFFISFWFKNN